MQSARSLLIALSLVATPASADNGLINKQSAHSATMTLDRLQAALESKGITIVARVRHQQNARDVGLELRPTELLIFGNPKLGTPLMTARQGAGIDLPMKALAWEDADGQVWLSYNDPAWIARRHGITDREPVVEKMATALEALTEGAVSRE